jgi:YesN/AraC family two-component response regulator
MQEFNNCKKSVQNCIEQKRFSVAHLYSEENTMDIHVHDCYEIYYSISGGKKFLIGDKCYDVEPGNIFVISNYESHYLSQIDAAAHERIVISIYPKFLDELSTQNTNLAYCFRQRDGEYSNRIKLDKDSQNRFIYYVHKITGASDYGADLIESSALVELMIMINRVFQKKKEPETAAFYKYNNIVGKVIEYINKHIVEKLSIAVLSDKFYVSESYICRVFKSETGTTINKYITARRISIAKILLMDGASVSEACEKSGFNDYVNFVKSFTKTVGTSPKRYAKYSTTY